MLALYKKKRAVSPVIAVILLIALTVATVAIIWQVVLPLLSVGTVSVTPVTTSATGGVWTGTVTVSEGGVLEMSLTNGSLFTLTLPADGALDTGENAVSASYAGLTGTFDVNFKFIATGAEGAQIETISVTFA